MADYQQDQNFMASLPLILRHEGGYVDDTDDAGGATNFGISLRFLEGLPLIEGDLNQDGTIDIQDIQDMTEDEAAELYYIEFWLKSGASQISNLSIASKFFDMAINMGIRQASKLLQSAANIANPANIIDQDGVLGPKSILAMSMVLPYSLLLQRFQENCELFYQNLVTANPSQGKFLDGWLNRLHDTGGL